MDQRVRAQYSWLPNSKTAFCTEITQTKKACHLVDVQAFVFLVAKGGIEPPTQGFSVLCSTN